jgi:hypothetical protein
MTQSDSFHDSPTVRSPAPQTDEPRARDAAARALLADLETQSRRMAEMRRALETAQIARSRLEAALEALAPALSPALAQEARRRLLAARTQAETARARAADGPQAALLDWLAMAERPTVGVGEAQDWLESQGHDIRRTYAAGALHHLAGLGVVQRIRRGKYRINRSHPELTALRLRALEAEMAGMDGD